MASFGKSVDQLEGSFPVIFQNEPSAFTRLGYTRPMLIFGNAISVEQHGNFAKVRKPCTIVRWTVKELFASPTGSETCGSSSRAGPEIANNIWCRLATLWPR